MSERLIVRFAKKLWDYLPGGMGDAIEQDYACYREQCATCGDSDCAGGLPCITGDGV